MEENLFGISTQYLSKEGCLICIKYYLIYILNLKGFLYLFIQAGFTDCTLLVNLHTKAEAPGWGGGDTSCLTKWTGFGSPLGDIISLQKWHVYVAELFIRVVFYGQYDERVVYDGDSPPFLVVRALCSYAGDIHRRPLAAPPLLDAVNSTLARLQGIGSVVFERHASELHDFASSVELRFALPDQPEVEIERIAAARAVRLHITLRGVARD